MNDISNMEANNSLVIQTEIRREGLRFYDAEQAPFKIFGLKKEAGKFRRMPENIANRVSERVSMLHAHTAGGRLRFVTDSPYVAIKVQSAAVRYSHMPMTGTGGFDMYSEHDGHNFYEGTFIPNYNMENGYENVIDFQTKCRRVVTIFFPLFSEVNCLYIGLQNGAVLEAAPEYRMETPVVFYGSSITQGGCASRPGNTYQAILSRRFDFDYVNLGFTGGAHGEELMAEYISGLTMSMFVLDYDHNALTPKLLEETHGRMFWKVRERNPGLPILLMSRPKYCLTPEEEQRLRVVHNTYLSAKAMGDENVYFLSGPELMELAGDNGTVDNCHPSDSGYLSMSVVVGRVLEEIWKR